MEDTSADMLVDWFSGGVTRLLEVKLSSRGETALENVRSSISSEQG